MRDELDETIKNGFHEVAEAAANVVIDIFRKWRETSARQQTAVMPETVKPNATANLMNRNQIAAFLNVSVRTVDNLKSDGLPFVRIGNRVLFDAGDALTWLKSNKKARQPNKLRLAS